MRKSVITLSILTFLGLRTMAQTSLELIPNGGWTFGSRTNFYDTYGKIDGAANIGGSLKFNVNRNFGIEVLYNHVSTQSGLYEYGDHRPLDKGDLALDYIMIGPVESFTIPGSTVRPYVGALLGAAVMTPGMNPDYESDTKFAVGAQLGANIYVSPRVGLQLKAQMLSPVDGTGAGFYFSNYGAGAGISTYSSIYQFSLNAGLIIGLGRILGEPEYHRVSRPLHRPRYRYYY